MMKEIMNRAWVIARRAENRFGYRASEYIAEAMKMAWAEAKENRMPASDEAVIRLGHVDGAIVGALGYGEDRDIGELNIVRETVKAIQVSFVGKTIEDGDEEEAYDSSRTEWLPKSQIRVINGYVIMKKWLIGKKNFQAFVA